MNRTTCRCSPSTGVTMRSSLHSASGASHGRSTNVGWPKRVVSRSGTGSLQDRQQRAEIEPLGGGQAQRHGLLLQALPVLRLEEVVALAHDVVEDEEAVDLAEEHHLVLVERKDAVVRREK